jgi:hypothetical protein
VIVTDHDVRDLLLSVPRSSFRMPRQPRGTVAVLRSRVIEAGGDVEAVEAWVTAHGGYADRTDPIPSQAIRPGSLTSRETPAEVFYVMPADALAAD